MVDSHTAPGDTLLETLEYIGMSYAELAQRMGYPMKVIIEIIQGKGAITPEIAGQFEEILQIPAGFWLRYEQGYRAYLARLAANPHLTRWVRWLNMFPIQEMLERGWVPSSESPTQQVFELLKFFEEPSTATWQVHWNLQFKRYLKSPLVQRHYAALSAWIRQGEIKSQEVFTKPYYDAEAFRKALSQIRSLLGKPVNCLRDALVRLCAEAGVAVVFVEELPDLEIRAATNWCFPVRAIIQMSPRYETDEQLLLTFFHAAGHILLHDDDQVFLEIDQEARDEAEEQADRFAANLLIDTTQWQEFIEPGSYRTEKGVTEFAQKVGIAPGIVVRRLQQEKLLPLDHFNHLKRHVEWQSSPQRPISLG